MSHLLDSNLLLRAESRNDMPDEMTTSSFHSLFGMPQLAPRLPVEVTTVLVEKDIEQNNEAQNR